MSFPQANRSLRIHSPLGDDALLLTRLHGREGLAHSYCFRLEFFAIQPIRFSALLGKPVSVEVVSPRLPGPRYFHGIIGRLRQGPDTRNVAMGTSTLIAYEADLVPPFELLRHKVQSRIFQGLSVPDILKQILKVEAGLNVSTQITMPNNFPAHNYRVQYQESTLAFANRLMEEAGLYYFFTNSAQGCEMVVTDRGVGYPALSQAATVAYDPVDGGVRSEPRVTEWVCEQSLCSTSCQIGDYHFELPSNRQPQSCPISASVALGQGEHQFKVVADDLPVQIWPGRYSHYFDGVDPSGKPTTDLNDLPGQQVYQARLRMEQEAAGALQAHGAGDCPHFQPGSSFQLQRHYSGAGGYLLTRVEHDIVQPEGIPGEAPPDARISTRFQCLPEAMPFRSARITPRPRIEGAQTAVVTGTAGESITCDQYGRVQVQFPWNGPGQTNPGNSCWIRVAQAWAGQQWGAQFLPRIGQEVLIVFLDGDPDRPVIAGSLYNAAQMPPFTLPANRDFSGIRSHTVNGSSADAHMLQFVDTQGKEAVNLHSTSDINVTAMNNETHAVGGYYRVLVGQKPDNTSGSGSGGGSPDAGTASLIVGSGSGGGFDWSGQTIANGDYYEVEWASKTTVILGTQSKVTAGLYSNITGGLYLGLVFGAQLSFNLGGPKYTFVVPLPVFNTANYTYVKGADIKIVRGQTEGYTGQKLEYIKGDNYKVVYGNVVEAFIGTKVSKAFKDQSTFAKWLNNPDGAAKEINNETTTRNFKTFVNQKVLPQLDTDDPLLAAMAQEAATSANLLGQAQQAANQVPAPVVQQPAPVISANQTLSSTGFYTIYATDGLRMGVPKSQTMTLVRSSQPDFPAVGAEIPKDSVLGSLKFSGSEGDITLQAPGQIDLTSPQINLVTESSEDGSPKTAITVDEHGKIWIGNDTASLTIDKDGTIKISAQTIDIEATTQLILGKGTFKGTFAEGTLGKMIQMS